MGVRLQVRRDGDADVDGRQGRSRRGHAWRQAGRNPPCRQLTAGGWPPVGGWRGVARTRSGPATPEWISSGGWEPAR